MTGVPRREEQRTARRFDCKDVRLSYTRQGGLLARLFLAKPRPAKPVPVRNLSRDGVCFLCRESLRQGEELAMVIQLGARGPTLHARGAVRWCGFGEGIYGHKVRIRFTDVPPDSRDVLSRVEIYLQPVDQGWTRWRLRSREKASRPFGLPPGGKPPAEQ